MNNFELILQKYTQKFKNSILFFSNLSKNKHISTKSGGFPIFLDSNIKYYEQNWLDEFTENAIWKYLVNGVFKELFSEKFCKEKEIVCDWITMNHQLCFSYVEEIEKKYPFEFIITRKEKRIGYRYTMPYWDRTTLNQIIQKNNIHEIIIIDFSSEMLSSFLHPSFVNQEIMTRVSISDFINEFFPEFCDLYIKSVKQSVSEALDHIGLTTIQNLSNDYLPFFIKDRMDLLTQRNIKDINYHIFGSLDEISLKPDKKRIIEDSENYYISEDDKSKMDQNFYNNGRFQALCGKEDFALSFITSEYLYETLKKNNCFDLTSIICGYLKSIEQLLFKFILLTLDNLNGNEDWSCPLKIKQHYKRINARVRTIYKNIYNEELDDQFFTDHTVKFKTSTKEYFDTTFGSLAELLDSYTAGWEISDNARSIISTYLLIYCQECRNDHLHKDTIREMTEVDYIRDNTWLLLYYLLGGFKLTGNKDIDNCKLGILDRSFENMYFAIMRQYGCGNYYLLEFSDGEQKLFALPMNQEIPVYDENGLLINKKIRFIRINRDVTDDWYQDDWSKIERDTTSENVLYVAPDNMPVAITYVDKIKGTKKTVIW